MANENIGMEWDEEEEEWEDDQMEQELEENAEEAPLIGINHPPMGTMAKKCEKANPKRGK